MSLRTSLSLLVLVLGVAPLLNACRSPRVRRDASRPPPSAIAPSSIARPASAAAMADPLRRRPAQQQASFWGQFIDDEDGKFDLSEFMARPGGFLPVIIPITEPAVGFGAAGIAAFFHPQKEPGKRGPSGQRIAPAVTAVGGLATENGTWGVMAGHMNNWNDDRIRYTGALFHVSVNLKYYGLVSELGGAARQFNIEGSGTIQDAQVRLGNTPLFAGLRYSYFNNHVRAENLLDMPWLEPLEFDSQNAGLGLSLNYDSRDNTFTPSKGYRLQAIYTVFDEALGGDFGYQQFDVYGLAWYQLSRRLNLGLRLDGKFVRGAAPFYALPFISLRGIPAMRYQGDDVIVGETELRYDVDSRWSVVGFTGVGRASRDVRGLFDKNRRAEVQTAWNAGTGLRYLVTRKHGLRMGFDIARGPEDWAFYVTVGNGWNRL